MPSTLGTLRQKGRTCITNADTAIDAYELSIVISTYLALTVNRKVNAIHMLTANISEILTTIAILAIDNE